MSITKKGRKNRIEERIPYTGHIFFSTKSGLFEGELENYSAYGLFIKTQEDITVGEFITVALPYLEDKLIKFQGQILWRNKEGYGVELVRKRSVADLQLLKIDARSR
jgi:hypothetical protein